MDSTRRIGATDLFRRLEQGEAGVIIDVREPEEYRTLHAAGALLLPLGEIAPESLGQRLAAAGCRKDATVYFICHSGPRSIQACERLREDFPDGTVIEGGTLAWAQAGLPVHFGEKP